MKIEELKIEDIVPYENNPRNKAVRIDGASE